MDLYLFSHLLQDAVIEELLQIKQGERPSMRLYTGLMEFAMRRAYTGKTVREYVIRRVLSGLALPYDPAVMEGYLLHDIAVIYDVFYMEDYSLLLRGEGRLPLPTIGTRQTEVPGEQTYKKIVYDMVHAECAEELSAKVQAFFTSYRDEKEAMYRAFRWDAGVFCGVQWPDGADMDHLLGLFHQKETILENTAAFLAGKPCNDVLLVGTAGSGKSSLVKAVLNCYAGQGLRLIELSRDDLVGLPMLLERLRERKKQYILFIDDLSFEEADEGYMGLKVALDGQVSRRPENVVIYATSNRRHLVRELWKERGTEEEIHLNDTRNEKLSLSERFGIHLYFSVLSQEAYFDIIRMLFQEQGIAFTEEIGKEAAAWALEHNGRSGRSAHQFAAHYMNKYISGSH